MARVALRRAHNNVDRAANLCLEITHAEADAEEARLNPAEEAQPEQEDANMSDANKKEDEEVKDEIV